MHFVQNRLFIQTKRILLLQHARCYSDSSHTSVDQTLSGDSHRDKQKTIPYKDLSCASRELLDKIIRVDHAGELGADRIYAGQISILKNSSVGPIIQHMWDQEKEHKAKFEELIPLYRVRPSLLTPIWNVAGFALGAGTALLGKEAAMACTVAVESVITDHYNSQLRALLALPEYDKHEGVQELVRVISKFRDDEMEHHDTGLEHDAEMAPAYQVLTAFVKLGSRAAVWVAERV
ncbi:5-demethoxyubiquinone hydroxylase, mitochondrial [Hyalella azteca]|uniref:5-demethoxyubiquinone hydroxylase, mitochondrial n=1 Tax=Hyalella azteca TaxID=294128 RepID=A0A8B7N0F5_HYAAZ|nr:5-demethoxyubiquinone hydroxylase, mitochondrial [Hyalella azteca]